jgi:hypothetical protein
VCSALVLTAAVPVAAHPARPEAPVARVEPVAAVAEEDAGATAVGALSLRQKACFSSVRL